MKKTVVSLFIAPIMTIGVFSSIVFSYSSRVSAITLPTNVDTSWMSDAEVNQYYDGVEGLKGDPLLESLSTIIDGHREYDYENNTHRYIYKIIDRNWALSPLTAVELSNYDYVNDNPFIHKLYADYNDSAETADRFKNDGATRVSFDKEHIWAQSLGNFGRTSGAGSDFHSLWPSDVKGNQQGHSNYNFAVPTSGISDYNNDYGTYVGRNGYISGAEQKVFEPLDQYKGDIARAMFYMPARYYTYIDVLHPKLELVNGSPSAIVASNTQSGLAGDLETLLLWNELDPVDEYEIRRNNLIFNNYQLNRNPFIDHPEWARIAYDTSYSGSGASVAPESSSVGLGVVDPTDLVSISVTNNPSKVDYYVGATLDPTGLVITGTQSDNNIVTVANYTLTINGSSSLVLNTVGVNVVTVTVDTLTTTFNVFVGAKENLTLSPANATIAYNAEFDNSIISGSFSYTTANGTFTENVANADLSFGVYDTKNLGANLINVTHKSLSTSFTLTVTNLNASQPIATTNDLFFSEYIEGSSYNKALEIYNGTGEEKSLTSYSVHLFSNGATSPVTMLNLTGNIQNNDVYVISYSSADLVDITSQSDITSGVTNFNGDDAIGLYKNDILIDLIGVIGSDPGSAWTGPASNGAGSTVDKTLRRTETVSEPNTVFTWSEWEVYANDTTSDIGLHTFIGTSIDSEKYHLDQALAYAHFLLDETAPYCSVLNGGDSPWSYLQVEYSYMSAETKYAFYYNSTNEYILAAKARYEYLINKYSLVAFIDDGAGNILNARQTPNDYFTAEFENYIIIIAGFILFGFLFYSFSKKSSKA